MRLIRLSESSWGPPSYSTTKIELQDTFKSFKNKGVWARYDDNEYGNRRRIDGFVVSLDSDTIYYNDKKYVVTVESRINPQMGDPLTGDDDYTGSPDVFSVTSSVSISPSDDDGREILRSIGKVFHKSVEAYGKGDFWDHKDLYVELYIDLDTQLTTTDIRKIGNVIKKYL